MLKVFFTLVQNVNVVHFRKYARVKEKEKARNTVIAKNKIPQMLYSIKK